MKFKVFIRDPLWHFLHKYKLAPQNKALTVTTQYTSQTKQRLMWRNCIEEGYKVAPCYEDKPLDLSRALLLKTREH